MAKPRVLVPILAVAIGLVVLAAYLGVRAVTHTAQQPHCMIGNVELDTDQAAVAATMVGEASKFRPALPARAAVLALAAGLQESKLRNLAPGDGDRDSVGVLQQRPSQGWGGDLPAERNAMLNDVTEATREFLAALVRVKHWRQLPLAEAIQAVQISADGSAYAQHEDEATTLATSLRGRASTRISCSFDKPTKVATTAKVIAQLRHQLPVQQITASGGSVSVPGAQWQTASWFVANADRLGIDSVAYDGRRWSRAGGWKNSSAPRTAVVATMATLQS